MEEDFACKLPNADNYKCKRINFFLSFLCSIACAVSQLGLKSCVEICPMMLHNEPCENLIFFSFSFLLLRRRFDVSLITLITAHGWHERSFLMMSFVVAYIGDKESWF